GVVPAKYSIPILKQLASALDLAHSYNEIHRHLMPECIMVTEKGNTKILNLGLPYAGSDNEWVREPWRKNGWEAFYRAPEQWRGQICTTWTDVYALGCIAYEMLSGHVPFDVPDLNLLHGAVLLEMPPAILSLPVAAQGTITRSLAKKPSERFNSCEDYIRALAFETTPTKTVPKPTTGMVPSITQTTLGQDLSNVAWTAVATAVNPYIPPRQDTGTVRGTTKNIPVALPSLPNTGTVRSITRPVPTRSVTKSVTGRYSPYSTSHVPLDPNNLSADYSWSDESQGLKGIMLKVVIPFIIVALVASVMYYMLIRRMNEYGTDDFVYTQEDMNQLTPNQLPSNNYTYEPLEENLDNAEENNEKDVTNQEKEQGADTDKGLDKDSDKPSDETSPSPKDDSQAPPDAQPPKEGEKADGSTENASGREEMSYASDETEAITPVQSRKKMPKQENTLKRDALGTAIIEAYIGNQRIRNASITIGQKTFVGSVEAKAFISEKKKFDVSADFVDANHKSYHGELSFVIDWGDKRVVKVKMQKVAGSAIIVATVDGKPVEGADVFVDGKIYKTPDCEIEAKLDVERKVDAKVFYQDDTKGVMFGSQSFVIDWRGPKKIFIEIKERSSISSAEKTERLLALNVDDSPGSGDDSMAKDAEDKPVFMELLWVEPGSFEMGSDSEEAGREEKPRHTVQITNGFWLGKYEVTQEEYRAMARFVGMDDDRSSYVGPR
ncbi:MAG: SUMF1/EgtB/PvdO family nonheme iron enzyme, partial [Clostridia bacterium]|nr:SUMF1/EgtB/PvdO family nonheme iron enzyme [Clostridia bacterium]